MQQKVLICGLFELFSAKLIWTTVICTKSFSEVGAFVNQETKKPETKGNEMDYKEMWLGKVPFITS